MRSPHVPTGPHAALLLHAGLLFGMLALSACSHEEIAVPTVPSSSSSVDDHGSHGADDVPGDDHGTHGGGDGGGDDNG